MAEIVYMPQLSDTMVEGVVAGWFKKVGDTVSSGEVLAEIETDKATMEFEAFPGQEGKLLYVGTGEGESAPVDTVLAILGEDGEDIESLKGGESPVVEEETPVAEMPAPSAPEPVVETPAPVAASTPAAAPVAIETDGSIKASPLARKLAAAHQIHRGAYAGGGGDLNGAPGSAVDVLAVDLVGVGFLGQTAAARAGDRGEYQHHVLQRYRDRRFQ